MWEAACYAQTGDWEWSFDMGDGWIAQIRDISQSRNTRTHYLVRCLHAPDVFDLDIVALLDFETAKATALSFALVRRAIEEHMTAGDTASAF